jgi:hypothetical protein
MALDIGDFSYRWMLKHEEPDVVGTQDSRLTRSLQLVPPDIQDTLNKKRPDSALKTGFAREIPGRNDP